MPCLHGLFFVPTFYYPGYVRIAWWPENLTSFDVFENLEEIQGAEQVRDGNSTDQLALLIHSSKEFEKVIMN